MKKFGVLIIISLLFIACADKELDVPCGGMFMRGSENEHFGCEGQNIPF